MPAVRTAAETLNREYLEIRCRILDLAAAFDRLDRGTGSVAGDPRLSLIREALQALAADEPGRAERVQLVFSRTYDPEWRRAFGLGA